MNVMLCSKCEYPINGCAAHSHPTWEIVYQLSGRNRSVVGGRVFDIDKNDILIIPPKTEHSSVSEEVFSDMYFQAKELDLSGISSVHDPDGDVLVLMNMLHKTLCEKEYNYQKIADDLAEAISSFIKKHQDIRYRYPFVNAIKNSIYENIQNPDFSPGAEMKKTGYNIDHARRCFKAETGFTPHEYLMRLRIRQAKTFLVQDSFSGVEDTAKKCGFTDSFYFSSCFKKYTGLSPSRYRKERTDENASDGHGRV